MLTVSDKKREPTPFGGETLSSILSRLSMADRAFIQRFGNSLPPEMRTNLLRWVLLFRGAQNSPTFFHPPSFFRTTWHFPYITDVLRHRYVLRCKTRQLVIESQKGCLNVGGISAIWLSHFYLFILRCESRNNPIYEQPDWHLAEMEIESGRD